MSYQDMIKDNKVYENFLTLCPRDGTYMEYSIDAIPLKVLVSGNVEFTPDFKTNITKLQNAQSVLNRHYGDADSFTIKVIIGKDDVVDGHVHKEYYNTFPDNIINMTGLPDSVIEDFKQQYTSVPYEIIDYHDNLPLITLLNYWIKGGFIFNVVTEAMDVPNGLYVITSNPSRVQDHKNYTIWELEFTKWTGNTAVDWNFSNVRVNKAKKTYNQKKKAAAKSKAKQSTSVKTKLKKCDPKKIYYTKNKRVTDCTKYMQEILDKKGFYGKTNVNQVDGWYGPSTLKAVKAFKKKYKKKYGFNLNGTIGDKMIKALCTE